MFVDGWIKVGAIAQAYFALIFSTTSTYLAMASSLEVPLHFSQASHLALPLKSSMPGRAARIRDGFGQPGERAIWGHCLIGAARTGVHVADVGLLEPAVELQLLVVGALGVRLDLLGRLVEFLLGYHGAACLGLWADLDRLGRLRHLRFQKGSESQSRRALLANLGGNSGGVAQSGGRSVRYRAWTCLADQSGARLIEIRRDRSPPSTGRPLKPTEAASLQDLSLLRKSVGNPGARHLIPHRHEAAVQAEKAQIRRRCTIAKNTLRSRWTQSGARAPLAVSHVRRFEETPNSRVIAR